MTIEIILDILLSVIVLYVYHNDCTGFSPLQMQEFALVAVAAEGYDYSCIPTIATEPEWLLDADADADADAAADEAYKSFLADVGKLIDGNTGEPYTDVAAPLYTLEELQAMTVKALRSLAKEIGVKGASRKSKAELACGLAAYYSVIG